MNPLQDRKFKKRLRKGIKLLEMLLRPENLKKASDDDKATLTIIMTCFKSLEPLQKTLTKKKKPKAVKVIADATAYPQSYYQAYYLPGGTLNEEK